LAWNDYGKSPGVLPGAPLAVGTGYYVNISPSALKDLAGNAFAGIADNTSVNFNVVPNLSPVLTGSSTGSNGHVQPTDSLSLYFSEWIVARSGNITLVNEGNSADNRVISVRDTQKVSINLNGTLTLNNSSQPLLLGATYHVLMDSGSVSDATSSPFSGLSDPAAMRFSVQADSSAPHIASATRGSDGSSIMLRFNEPLAGTLESGDFTIKTSAGATLATVTQANYGINPNVVMLTLDQPLASGTFARVGYDATAGTPGSLTDLATPLVNVVGTHSYDITL